jgi:hypothetical protein
MIDIDLIIRCLERALSVIESHKECICYSEIISTYIDYDENDITLNCSVCQREIDRESKEMVIHG